MFKAIVTQPDSYSNFGFESLTPSERAEYEAWSDEMKKGTRYPLPEDFGFNPLSEDIDDDYIASVKGLPDDFISHRELIEQDLWKEAWLGYIPFDAELDAQHDLSGWERQQSADEFAQSQGYRDAHHLQGTADLLSAVLEMKALEAEIEFRNKRIALMEETLAAMQGGTQ